jgi:FeoB-associated Cys-rich membrane protein
MGQQLIVGAIVFAAAAFIVRRLWRAVASARASKQAGCDSGCGCAPTAQPSKRQRVDQRA